ncbi:DoxX [Trypanosoma theileri]|uniref:DoxX n=1 Tax=Trypanosoma theileri TaxID=67003 RepID=A0A1X0P9I8_9TRYP|nr:DoxX [Trypanosoma theileri]ORC93597.1 DoxX [Trypanosoma theileri]
MRTFLRYLGLLFILAVFIASGLQQIVNPSVGAALLAKSNFPQMLQMLGVQYRLRAVDYTAVIQATGAVFLGFSLFILLGVGRGFFAFMLALGTIVVTIAFHVNLENPRATTENDLFHVMKNLSITGALLFVAGSGHRSHNFSKAHREVLQEHKKK